MPKKKKKSPPASIAAIAEIAAPSFASVLAPSELPPSELSREDGSSSPPSSAASLKIATAPARDAVSPQVALAPAPVSSVASPKAAPAGASPPSVDSTESPAPESLSPPASNLAPVKAGSSLDPPSSAIGTPVPISASPPPVPVPNASADKPLWTDCVRGHSASMSKKGVPFVLESGEICVKIPSAVIKRNLKRWDNFIIGQFHGNPPPQGTLHAILNGIWSNRLKDISVSKFGEKSFLIKIPHAATRLRVINQGMWHIEDQAMFVAAWKPGLTPVMPELTEVPVWLEFRDVPLQYFSVEGLEHIAGMLGNPKFCHPSTINMTNLEVAKVFTIVDPRKNVPEAVNVQFDSGEVHRIRVSCPWLPPLCSYCQEVGHSIKRCPVAPVRCSACKSTTHDSSSCPRAKGNMKNAPSKEVKLNGRSKQTPKIPYAPIDSSPSTSKKTRLPRDKKRPPLHTGGALVLDFDLNVSRKQAANQVSAVQGKGKGKGIASPSSSVTSSSGTDPSSSEESAESSPASSDEDSPEDLEESFTPVISKKQRRYERNSRGKSPLSKNHH